jgi:ribonuclease E
VVEAPVVAEVAAPVVEAAPASALTENGRAPNDPREVRRRRKEAEAAAAAAAAQEAEHESKPLA